MWQSIVKSLAGYWQRRGEWPIIACALFILAAAVLTMSPGFGRFTKSALGTSGVLGRINANFNPCRTRQSLYDNGLDVYDLKIDPQQYRKIIETIEEASKRGRLTDELKTWAKAKLIHDGATHEVKVRLRGDLALHWTGTRKSWRIKFKKDGSLDGARELNLIVMHDGKSITQNFCNRLFAELGLMTLRDKYVVLRINGIPQGVYYQIEHFDNPLMAQHKRAESVIFTNHRGGHEIGSFKPLASEGSNAAWHALQILLSCQKDPTPEKIERALAVVDVDSMLKYIAGTTILCADHSSYITDNHRLYYDSSRGLFYPVPWDLEPQHIPKLQRFSLESSLASFDSFSRWPMSKIRIELICNPQYRLIRDRILWDLVKDDHLLTVFDEAYEGLDLVLWTDLMARGDEEHRIARFRRLVWSNLNMIRRVLSDGKTEATVEISGPTHARMEIAVNNASGVIVKEMTLSGASPADRFTLFRDTNENGVLDEYDEEVAAATTNESGVAALSNLDETLLPETEVIENYPAYYKPAGASSYKAKPLTTAVCRNTSHHQYIIQRESNDLLDDRPWPDVKILAENAVTLGLLTEQELVVRSFRSDDDFDPTRRTLSREAFLALHKQFTAHEENDHAIRLCEGAHVLEGTTVVPRDVTLFIDPGTTLRMGDGASLVCFGPIIARGSADAPIIIEQNTPQPWRTIASIQPKEECVFEHVHISGAGGGEVEGILFTGGLAVHEGDARLDHCRITNMRSEDGVNLKDGQALLTNCYFGQNASDAIDFDFTTGSVTSCHFEDCGGDAIDLSGVQMIISGNRIRTSSDKGISVGERSIVTIRNNLIVEHPIGIAIKDLSEATITNCTFVDCATALSAYRKKPIFGGGQAVASACVILGKGTPLTIDELSTVELRESIVPTLQSVEGCVTAKLGLLEELRSNDFVIGSNTTSIGDARSSQPSERPGIIAAPVDLR